MKSLVIPVDNLNLPYLARIADIALGQLDDDMDENGEIFEAATWFIRALADNTYANDDEDTQLAQLRFIEETEKFIAKIRATLPPKGTPLSVDDV